MDNSLAKKIALLKEEINNCDEVKKLNELNKKLDENNDVIKLAYAKDMASIEYEDSIKHFGENSIEAQKSQKRLYEAKLALDSNELVKQYIGQYKVVKKMYDKINEELFNPFK